MAKNSNISWTNHTFNPWWGCTKVSPGCTNCYAEALDKRFGGDLWGTGKARKRTSAKNWAEPLKWNHESAQDRWALSLDEQAGASNRRVFCASMADWLDPEVPVEWLADLLTLIDATPYLDWLLLTKRPELWWGRVRAASGLMTGMWVENWLAGIVPANVWIGTTVEDQERANERIPALLSIPARVRFLSCEPLLGSVHLGSIAASSKRGSGGSYYDLVYSGGPGEFDNVTSRRIRDIRVDWVICGGESGPKARLFDLAWARYLRDQCAVAGVAFFMKQLGDAPRNGASNVFLGAHHGANPAEWPADLQVQQFPTPA